MTSVQGNTQPYYPDFSKKRVLLTGPQVKGIPIPRYSSSINEVIELIRKIAPDTRTETRYIDDADGYTLAAPITSLFDLPGYNRSSKDGFAVSAEETKEASPDNPARFQYSGLIIPGSSDAGRISAGCCMEISTGGCLPDGADAVVMRENARVVGSSVEVFYPVVSGDNIIRHDEDAKAGEMVYPEGWVLRPQDIAFLSGIGIYTVQVRCMPIIGIISTGQELVPADARPARGEVREVNSYLISSICHRLGANPRRYGIAWEGASDLSDMLHAAVLECDAVIVSGGSSHDDRDRTAEIIANSGTLLLTDISLTRKKMVIGEIHGKPVIGLPGHPASVFLLLMLVVTNLIQAIKKADEHGLLKEQVIMGVDFSSRPDREHHIPVKIREGKAFPLSRKAGLVSLLSQCDGIIHIPKGKNGLFTGEKVDLFDLTLMRSPDRYE